MMALAQSPSSIKKAVLASFSTQLNDDMLRYIHGARHYIQTGEIQAAAHLLNDEVGKYLPRLLKHINYRHLSRLDEQELSQTCFHIEQILSMNDTDYKEVLSNIEVPTLFVNGTLDEYTSPKISRRPAITCQIACLRKCLALATFSIWNMQMRAGAWKRYCAASCYRRRRNTLNKWRDRSHPRLLYPIAEQARLLGDAFTLPPSSSPSHQHEPSVASLSTLPLLSTLPNPVNLIAIVIINTGNTLSCSPIKKMPRQKAHLARPVRLPVRHCSIRMANW